MLRIEPTVTCQGKVRFRAFNEAKKAAKRAARAHEGASFSPYPCKVCHGFHVGERLKRMDTRRPREEAEA